MLIFDKDYTHRTPFLQVQYTHYTLLHEVHVKLWIYTGKHMSEVLKMAGK